MKEEVQDDNLIGIFFYTLKKTPLKSEFVGMSQRMCV